MIIAGIWLTRIAKRVADQQRRELIAHWSLQNKMIDNALHQIETQKRQSVEILKLMSERISQKQQSERNGEESVLRDFKQMLSKH